MKDRLVALGERVDRFFERLGPDQASRPLRYVMPAAIMAVLSLPLIGQLELRGDLTALLPENAPAVQDLEQMQDRVGQATTLTVIVHGESREDVRTFARALAIDLESDLPEHAIAVDWNEGELDRYIEDNRFLFADYEELVEIRDALEERKEYETARSNPFYIQLDDEEPPDFEELVERLREGEEARRPAIESDFFEHEERPLVGLFIRTDVRIGEHVEGRALADEVEARARRVATDTGLANVEWDLGSDLMDSVEEAEALIGEVAVATTATVVLVLFSVYLFFLSNRSIPLLGLALVSPVMVTFGFAELTVDYLNSSSAFLGSIVVGNGVNPNVIWLARYFEERREGTPVPVAIENTHKGTWAATLTASMAAALAYASLIITDFRGFRDFGIIGGFGMVACWVGCIFVLPSLASLFERIRPIKRREAARRNIYGVAFRWAALKAPKVVVVAAAVLTVFAGWEVYTYVAADPMEYDFRKLQSERDPDSRVQWVNDRQGELVSESMTGSAMVMLIPEREMVHDVTEQLETIKEERPGVLGEITSIEDILPTRQEDKIELLAEIRALLLDIRRYAEEDQLEEIDAHTPPEEIAVLSPDDIPATASRPFTEKDGTLGRLVFVGHDEAGNSWDGKFMLRWAQQMREVELPNGERPPMTGNAGVFADLLDAIFRAAPKAVGLALLLTSILLIIGFRKWRDRILTLASLLVGILWMAALIALSGLRINFLNFLAFPITFGNGVDYGVNYMQRFVQEEKKGTGAARRAIEATGGAVVLCSMTTIFGYISLYASSNQALNSFGAAMAISEITCVAAAVVALPALLSLRGVKG